MGGRKTSTVVFVYFVACCPSEQKRCRSSVSSCHWYSCATEAPCPHVLGTDVLPKLRVLMYSVQTSYRSSATSFLRNRRDAKVPCPHVLGTDVIPKFRDLLMSSEQTSYRSFAFSFFGTDVTPKSLSSNFPNNDRNLKQNEARSICTESTHKGVNQRSKYITQVQQQRPESPTVTLTWHASKYIYKVHELHQRYHSSAV